MSLRKYWLTEAAAGDLVDIANYTLQTWGAEQLEVYRKRHENRLALRLKHPEMGRNHPMLRSDFRSQPSHGMEAVGRLRAEG